MKNKPKPCGLYDRVSHEEWLRSFKVRTTTRRVRGANNDLPALGRIMRNNRNAAGM